jgi:hypothetical protein
VRGTDAAIPFAAGEMVEPCGSEMFRLDAAKRGDVRSFPGAANRDAATDGTRFSPDSATGTGGESAGGAADGRDCAARVCWSGELAGEAWARANCGSAAGFAGGVQNAIVAAFARVSARSYRIPAPPVWAVALFFTASILLAVSFRMTDPRRTWISRAAISGIACAAAVIATYPFRPSTVAAALEMTVLRVGQGDSILVVSPRGSTLLIDGGGAFKGFKGREEHLGREPGEDVVSPYLWSRGFKKLDAVAATHVHQDHIGGLTAILQNFHVGRVWLGRETAAPGLTRFEEVVERMHVPIEHELRRTELYVRWRESGFSLAGDFAGGTRADSKE